MKPTIRQLRNALILVLGLIGCAVAIRETTPAPFIQYLTPKVAHLQENPNKYDVLFVGSSRVFRQVIPGVFDEQVRKHDLDLRSFNAGIPAAKSVEVWHFLNLLADDQRIRPQYVFVEPDGLLVGIKKENSGTVREVYWHKRAETTLAIRSLETLKTVPRIRMSVLHAGSFLFNRLGVGRLRVLGSQMEQAAQARWINPEGLGPDGDGWAPFAEGNDKPAFPRRKEFIDNLPRYRRLLARQSERLSDQECMTDYHADMLSHFKAAIEALGAEPIFILSPALRPRCEVHEAFRRGLLPNLIAFDDASNFPELYEVEHRFDFEHLNTEGALVYSRLLADRFAEHLREDRGRGGT